MSKAPKKLRDKIELMIIREIKKWDGVTCYGDVCFMAEYIAPRLTKRILNCARAYVPEEVKR